MGACFCCGLCLLLRYLYVGIFPAVCGRVMSVLPCAAQSGGLLSTGVIFVFNLSLSERAFSLLTAGDQITSLGSCSPPAFLNSRFTVVTDCVGVQFSPLLPTSALGHLRGQSEGLIND